MATKTSRYIPNLVTIAPDRVISTPSNKKKKKYNDDGSTISSTSTPAKTSPTKSIIPSRLNSSINPNIDIKYPAITKTNQESPEEYKRRMDNVSRLMGMGIGGTAAYGVYKAITADRKSNIKTQSSISPGVKSTEPTPLKNNNSTYAKTKVIYPKAKGVTPRYSNVTSDIGSIIANHKQVKPVVSQAKPVYVKSDVGSIIARASTKMSYEKLFDEAIAKQEETVAQRKLKEATYKATKNANKEFGKNLAREIATGKPAPVKPIVAEEIKPTKTVTPIKVRTKVIPSSAKQGGKQAAMRRLPNQLPSGKFSLNEFQDIMKNTFKETSAEKTQIRLKGVRSGVMKANALAVPVQLLAEAGIRKEAWQGLVSQYGEKGAKEYIEVARRRKKEANTSKRSDATNAGTAQFEDFYAYGGKLNKGWGDILGGAMGGASTGLAIGSAVPGIGNAIGAVGGAIIGGVKGFFDGRQKDKMQSQEEAAMAEQAKLMKEQQRRSDAAYMANYRPIQMNSLFAYGGDLDNPVPNKFKLQKRKVPLVINGEPTGRFIDKVDTLYLQDNGVWAEKLTGKYIPDSLPRDSKGNVILPSNKKAMGGKLSGYNPKLTDPMKLSNADVIKYAGMNWEEAAKLGLPPVDMLRIASMKQFTSGKGEPYTMDIKKNAKGIMNPEYLKMDYKHTNKALGGDVAGNVAIPNKNAIPINPKAELVTNNQGGLQGSHETGTNIPVINDKGVRTAQVEPKEVIMTTADGTQVALSHRLGFAQKYMELDAMMKLANNKLKGTTDDIQRSTTKRNIDKLKTMMELLPKQQEEIKARMGVADGQQKGLGDILNGGLNRAQITIDNGKPQAYPSDFQVGMRTIPNSLAVRSNNLTFPTPKPSSFGEFAGTAFNRIGGLDGLGQLAQIALPFAANMINNRRLDKSMARINNLQNTPIKHYNLDDKVDTSAQITEVNRSYRDAVNATRGVSDARTAAMMKGQVAASRISPINQIQETASNVSRGIRNQNISSLAESNRFNALRNDELTKYKTEAATSLDMAKNQGTNTTIDNIFSIIKQGNLATADRDALVLIMKTMNNNGTLTRADLDLLKRYGIDPNTGNTTT